MSEYTPLRLISRKVAAGRVGYHEVHLRRLEVGGKFPASVRIGANRIGYVESEVEAWIQAKINARDATEPARHLPHDHTLNKNEPGSSVTSPGSRKLESNGLSSTSHER